MQCISVYTTSFEMFSDIYEQVLSESLNENEEKEIKGIVVIHSGDVPEHYLERMEQKLEVAVLKDKQRNVTILQHGNVFEILLPS